MVKHRDGEGRGVVGSVYATFPLILEDYFPHFKVFYYSSHMHKTFMFSCQS